MIGQKKNTLITGASSGIGAEIARQLSRRGEKLAIVARRRNKLEDVAAECAAVGGEVYIVEADVGVPDDCARLVAEAVGLLGGLDVLLLNAGVSQHERVDAWESPNVADDVMQINYMGAVRCAWHALPHLKQSHGLIAVVSSLQGKAGFPGSAGYSASKFALHGFFESLRSELVDDEVDVTIICPGPVESEINDARPENAPGVMAVDECAHKTIRAMDRRKREEIMTFGGKVATVLRPIVPGLIDDCVRKRLKEFYKG